jgi:hypothetical protein
MAQDPVEESQDISHTNGSTTVGGAPAVVAPDLIPLPEAGGLEEDEIL